MIVLIHHDLDLGGTAALGLRTGTECASPAFRPHGRVHTSFFSVANSAAGLYWPR